MARRNTLKWFEEMRQWVEGSDLEKLRGFLSEHGIARKMNLGQTRKQALQVLDRLQIQVSLRARENAAKRKSQSAAKPEAEVEQEEPEPRYVTEDLLGEVVRELKGDIAILRGQTDAQVQELRRQLEELSSQVLPLMNTVRVLSTGLADLQKRLGERALKRDLPGLVSDQVETLIERARKDWQAEVRDGIDSILEGKERRRFLGWWDDVVTWLGEKPRRPQQVDSEEEVEI